MQRFILWLIHGIVSRLFLKLFVGVKFSSSAFLLKEKQFIITANHNSHLDTMTLLASLPWKILHKVKPVAAADHFGKTKFKAWLSEYFINALLIQRKRDKDNPENDPINRMLKAIDNGFSLILFPEGTRGEPEVLQALKPGIGFVLSQRPHVKYVPAFMKGMGKAMPKGDNLIVPHSCTLTFGSPTEVQSREIEEILKQIEGDLNELRSRS